MKHLCRSHVIPELFGVVFSPYFSDLFIFPFFTFLFFLIVPIQSLFFSNLKNSYSPMVQKQILEQQTKEQGPKTRLKRLLWLRAELDLLL